MVLENTHNNRLAFFGDRLKPYHGDLNTDTQQFSIIDGKPVHIDRLTEHKAEGWVWNDDKLDWFVALKSFDQYATALTAGIADAKIAKQEMKIPREEKQAQFKAMYAKDQMIDIYELTAWYRRMVGACWEGREQFASEHGIDLNGRCTPLFFLKWLEDNGMLADAFREIMPYYEDGECYYEASNSDSTLS